ncbi:hypothetical protein EBV26_05035 [bacterium]|nr:hypothetical protein [bacterium]
MATIQNLYIDQGTTYSLSITVSDQNGDVKDLTDYAVRGQLRKSYYSSTSTSFTATASSPLDGEITISLTATQTSALKAGRYVYDIEIENDEETLRVLEGIVVINPEVTR